MRHSLALTALVALTCACWAGTPAEALADARADAEKLSADLARHTRYLSTYHMTDEEAGAFAHALGLHVNVLSTRARITRPRPCGKNLYAVDLRDYGWQAETWEKLAAIEPYWHVHGEVKAAVFKEVTKYREKRVGTTDAYGRFYYRIEREPYTERVLVEAGKEAECLPAPWVSGEDYEVLKGCTHSCVPVVRADWWFTQTAVAADREVGYYEWLGVEDEKGLAQVVGLDVAAAQKVEREVAAIVPPGRSGVAAHGRQLWRFGTVAGSWWESRDVLEEPRGKRNPVAKLDGDYQFQAKEVFALLPNGLFAFGLFDAEGKVQDFAPPEIGSDDTSTSRDYRIHVCLSCMRCHAEGLRPIDDYARRVFRNAVTLKAKDKATLDRLKLLYLEPLQRWVTRDVADYTFALSRIGGADFTPEKASAAYAAAWKRWHDDPVSLTQLAREVGCEPLLLAVELRRYADREVLPLDLAGLIAEEAVDVPRTSVEEHFALIAGLVGGRK